MKKHEITKLKLQMFFQKHTKNAKSIDLLGFINLIKNLHESMKAKDYDLKEFLYMLINN